MWKGEALGIFPPVADATVCEKEAQSLLPPTLLPRVKAQGYNIKSNISAFYIENVLELELWIQMVRKESMGVLKAATQQGSRRRQGVSDRDNASQERGLCSLCAVGLQPPTSPTQKISSSEVGFCLWLDSPPRVSSVSPLGFLAVGAP